MASPTAIAAYLALFASVGFIFLFVNLLVGWFLRPEEPNTEKLEVYECGEPTIGSSFVQFDLRFYVVALLFIIFDVEVAFFFPWATVFGKATQLMDENVPVVFVRERLDPAAEDDAVPNEPGSLIRLSDAEAVTYRAAAIYREMGIADPSLPSLDSEAVQRLGANASADEKSRAAIENDARRLAYFAVADIAVFFGVLVVGFAYVWRRGDLDWVRAVHEEPLEEPELRAAGGAADQEEPVLSG